MTAATLRWPDFPFEPREFSRPAGTLRFLDVGSGPPVIMLHGNPNWSFYYRHAVAALQDRFRCLVPDHLGCGLSDKPNARQYRFRLRDRIDDLTAWIDSLHLAEPVHLIVHDWGGMIGCGWAVDHAERVGKLCILNTAAFHRPRGKPIPWQLKLARLPWIGPALMQGLNAFSRGAVRSCVTKKPLSAEVADAYCAPYDSWEHRLAVLRFVLDIPLKPGDESYDTVSHVENTLSQLADKPMLLGWGERDFVFDLDYLRGWTERFPNAEVHRYPDCGHYILEDAREELLPLIREFLLGN